MIFQSLKLMINSLMNSYKCPKCTSGIEESNIDIMGAAGTSINIDIECPKCGKHSMIKSEVLSVDASNIGLSADKLSDIKKIILEGGKNSTIKANVIKDEEIVNLNTSLKKEKLNVSDLLGNI